MSPTTTMQDAERMVRALEADFERNANARNAQALAEGFYAENAQLLPPNSPPVKGRQAIRQFWEEFFAAGFSDLKLVNKEIGASGELVYNIGEYGYTAEGARHNGKYVVVYRRQPDGAFKVVVDSFSDNA